MKHALLLVELSIALLRRFCEIVKQPKQFRTTRVSLAGLPHQRYALARNNAFSLVELSIVLVILGLLTGGILTGQNLIRAAELRSITTEFQAYQTAVHTFRDKYFALPGDMNNATDFWGAADTSGTGGECGDPDNDTGTATQTCNGNSNGHVDPGYEMFRFWQHLANAGLIEGSYTGVLGTGTATSVNVPPSKISNAGWSAYYLPDGHSNINEWAMDYGNLLMIGRAQPSGYFQIRPAISPEEAWNIDSKMDDGLPASGMVYSLRPGSPETPGCTSNDDPALAEYSLSNTSILCILSFKAGY